MAGQNYQRIVQLPDSTIYSSFLWGPRRTGKSHLLRTRYPESALIDLLKTDVFAEYSARPALLRERFQNYQSAHPIIIDEIQMCPSLLDEVHWLIENTPLTFILTGSSARKLRRVHANLLAGRAIRRQLKPLCAAEIGIDSFDLEQAMKAGLLPAHYNAPPSIISDMLRSYIGDYLRDEIASEAVVRNLPAFSEFLRVAAITSGDLLNYTNVARETGVSAKVVRGYFEILEDTLLGFRIRPWSGRSKRRLIETEKFYLFDIGITHFLSRRVPVPKTPEYGKSFEHYILMELLAYQAYKNPDLDITFWRTAAQQEVDFILGDREVAIEIKSSDRVHEGDLRHLALLAEDGPLKKRIVVSNDTMPRVVSDRYGPITILPWRAFLLELWAGGIV